MTVSSIERVSVNCRTFEFATLLGSAVRIIVLSFVSRPMIFLSVFGLLRARSVFLSVVSYIFQAQIGWTALMFAARAGHTECVRLLLELGADKVVKDYVRDLHYLACQSLLFCVFNSTSAVGTSTVYSTHETLFC